MNVGHGYSARGRKKKTCSSVTISSGNARIPSSNRSAQAPAVTITEPASTTPDADVTRTPPARTSMAITGSSKRRSAPFARATRWNAATAPSACTVPELGCHNTGCSNRKKGNRRSASAASINSCGKPHVVRLVEMSASSRANPVSMLPTIESNRVSVSRSRSRQPSKESSAISEYISSV